MGRKLLGWVEGLNGLVVGWVVFVGGRLVEV